MAWSKLMAVTTLGLIVLSLGASAPYYLPYLRSPLATTSRVSPAESCDRPEGFSLLILDDNGFNDSRAHGVPETPWPLIQASKGETVNLLVCNLDRAEPHGFSIDHYFDAGIALKPGQAFKLSFLADTAGSFRVYCNIFCSVHQLMRSGRLTVS